MKSRELFFKGHWCVFQMGQDHVKCFRIILCGQVQTVSGEYPGFLQILAIISLIDLDIIQQNDNGIFMHFFQDQPQDLVLP